MRKRIITLFIIFLTITSGVSLVSAQNETEEEIILTSTNKEEEVKNESERIGENVTANESGYLNISFNDDYNGYCINKGWKGAVSGDDFTVKNTSAAINNNNGEEIGNYIKILFVDFHYEVTKNSRLAQNVIWSFSNDYYDHKYTSYVDEIIKIAQSGRVIKDHGETININNTTKATFNFEVLSSGLEGFQSFFGYKITYSDLIKEEPPLGAVDNETEKSPNFSMDNILQDPPKLEASNNTTEEISISNSTNDTDNKTVDADNSTSDETEVLNNESNVIIGNDEAVNNTTVNSHDPIGIDLKNHATGYSLIFAILVILLLGGVLTMRFKKE